MIFEALYLALTLGSEKAQQNAAAIEARRMMNDEEAMRREFFAKSRKWKEDMFSLFAPVGEYGTSKGFNCNEVSWEEALEKLDLLEEGYFPYETSIRPTELSSEKSIRLNKYELEECHYKIEKISIIDGKPCSFGYLALSNVENYISFRKSIGGFYMPSMYEQMPQEIRNLFYAGKVTIGIPFGQNGYTPCQVMTIQEARGFMSRTMEERFQKYWAKIRG